MMGSLSSIDTDEIGNCVIYRWVQALCNGFDYLLHSSTTRHYIGIVMSMTMRSTSDLLSQINFGRRTSTSDIYIYIYCIILVQ